MKPTNLTANKSTAVSQHLEMVALTGGRGEVNKPDLQDKIDVLIAANNEGASTVARLNAELDAEKEAHAATQAALTAATATQQPAA